MIKQPILAGISVLLLGGVAYFLVERNLFLRTAQKTQGTVREIRARDGRCGGKYSRHACTRFSAHVQFVTANGQSSSLNISAGSARGHGQPITRASYRPSQSVPVIYNPKRPAQAYHDSFFGVWGTPLFLAVFQFATFLGSLTERRRA